MCSVVMLQVLLPVVSATWVAGLGLQSEDPGTGWVLRRMQATAGFSPPVISFEVCRRQAQGGAHRAGAT